MDVMALALSFVGFIITMAVLHYVIKSASKSSQIYKEQLRQSLYLEAMAKKQGITEQEIEAINTSVDKVTWKG